MRSHPRRLGEAPSKVAGGNGPGQGQQRAQLSSCQLPMYFIGWRGWLDTREDYKKRKGAAFQLSEFHDAALKESAVPLPALPQLLK